MPSILGWLITGMILGPHALGLMPQAVVDSQWYKLIITWMQCAFGLMLGTELIWKKIKNYGKALMITTLTQSLGTFLFVSFIFAIIFYFAGVPIYLAFAFGGIALATAPAPALSIVQEFHTSGPVTDTLIPMAVLDDIVGIAVFFYGEFVYCTRCIRWYGSALYDPCYDFPSDYHRRCCWVDCWKNTTEEYEKSGHIDSPFMWNHNYDCNWAVF